MVQSKDLVEVEYYVRKLGMNKHLRYCKQAMRNMLALDVMEGKAPTTKAGVVVCMVSEYFGLNNSFD